MSIDWVRRTAPALQTLLDEFRNALPQYIPAAESAMLFGGITMGAFSPRYSDVDLIVWVDADEVTREIEAQAARLWQDLAHKPLGELIYLYVAPKAAAGGPMTIGGGGAEGQPRSLRVYRDKVRPMAGYPLSLPDTVSLKRYGAVLWGQDLRPALPPIPDDWALVFLRSRVASLLQAFAGQPPRDVQARAEALGAEGAMAEPFWCARQLYSLMTGEMLAKDHAAWWYLGRRQDGPLAEALRLVLGWRHRGEAPEDEIVQAVGLIRPALHDFFQQALACLGIHEPALPPELPAALAVVGNALSRYAVEVGSCPNY